MENRAILEMCLSLEQGELNHLKRNTNVDHGQMIAALSR